MQFVSDALFTPAQMDSVEQFVMEPAAQGVLVKCRVTRDRRGMDRGFYPTYFLHMEKDDGKKAGIMADRPSPSTHFDGFMEAQGLEGETVPSGLRCRRLCSV